MATRWNIVVDLFDDCPADWVDRMTYLGSGLNAEHGNVVTFTRAYGPGLCAPCRASYFTGQHTPHHGVVNNAAGGVLDWGRAVAAALARVGYRNGYAGKKINNQLSASVEPGYHDWHAAQHPPSYYDYALKDHNAVITNYGSAAADYFTTVVSDLAVNFINTAPEPFYLTTSHRAAHNVPTPAPGDETLYTGQTPTRGPNHNEADISDKPLWLRTQWPAQRTGSEINTDDAAHVNQWRTLASADRHVEDVFDALAARGILDRTLYVAFNDNAYMRFEHRLDRKSVPYEECINVGMRMRWPGVTSRTEHSIVSVSDLAPTFYEIAGAKPLVSPDGMSLVPLVEQRVDVDHWRDDLVFHYEGITTSSEDVAYIPTWDMVVHRTANTATGHEKYIDWDGDDPEHYTAAQVAAGELAASRAINTDLAVRLAMLEDG